MRLVQQGCDGMQAAPWVEASAPFPARSLAADSPSAFQDVLYTLLVVLLGVTAFNERKTLL